MGNAESQVYGDGFEEADDTYNEYEQEPVNFGDEEGSVGVSILTEPAGVGDGSIVSGFDDFQDFNSLGVLFQLIPYYGQQKHSTDSTVRSALSGLSIDDIDSRDEAGNTLLLLACQYMCEDLVRIILHKGANPNASNQDGACGLHFSCYKETASKTVTKLLLLNGANPDALERGYGCSPLHYAAAAGDLSLCEMLVKFGASSDVSTICHDSLHYYHRTILNFLFQFWVYRICRSKTTTKVLQRITLVKENVVSICSRCTPTPLTQPWRLVLQLLRIVLVLATPVVRGTMALGWIVEAQLWAQMGLPQFQ
jgi:hypothetical protein